MTLHNRESGKFITEEAALAIRALAASLVKEAEQIGASNGAICVFSDIVFIG
jgi:hypothetical protein